MFTGSFEYTTSVLPDWIDHNGHMNVAYYVVAFDEATDAVYEEWGLGLDYPNHCGCSVFTLGMNVDYFAELFAGDPIRVTTNLIDVDDKRIHYFHQMFVGESARLVARNECLCMNVDLDSRQSKPFPTQVRKTLRAAVYGGPRPDGFGRALGIRR